MYNGTTTILGKKSGDYMETQQELMYLNEDQLLNVPYLDFQAFKKNQKHHTKAYRDLYRLLMLSNMCTYNLIDSEGNIIKKEDCEEYQDGIMKQGLYVAEIQFLDSIKQLYIDFINSPRDRLKIQQYFNNPDILDMIRYQLVYFKSSIEAISSQSEADILNLY